MKKAPWYLKAGGLSIVGILTAPFAYLNLYPLLDWFIGHNNSKSHNAHVNNTSNFSKPWLIYIHGICSGIVKGVNTRELINNKFKNIADMVKATEVPVTKIVKIAAKTSKAVVKKVKKVVKKAVKTLKKTIKKVVKKVVKTVKKAANKIVKAAKKAVNIVRKTLSSGLNWLKIKLKW